METITIFNSCLEYFGYGFIGGVMLAYVAKIISVVWASALKFFQ